MNLRYFPVYPGLRGGVSLRAAAYGSLRKEERDNMEKQESLWVAKPLKLAGARNVRDLGGYPAEDDGTVQSGRFYRGDSTAGLTGEDVRLLQQLGVGCVVDLRSGQETERAPSALRETPGVDYYAAPMLDQVTSSAFQGKLPERMGEVYVELLTHMGEQFVRILELFAAHRGRACLFHCTAGKDRTGVTAMLLLLLAGVPREVIIADYSATGLYMKESFAQQKRWAEETFGKAPPDHVFSSDPAEIEMALAYLEEEYGTARDYLRQNGASEELLCSIREMLLSPRG